MELSNLIPLKKREFVSIIGSGGKTSVMLQLSAELSKHDRVMLTTTTKIFTPPVQFCSRIFYDSPISWDVNPVCLAGGNESGKLSSPPLELLSNLYRTENCTILCEADGSKRMGLKLYAGAEPVYTGSESYLIMVISIASYGELVTEQNLHRVHLAPELLGRKIDRDLIMYLLRKHDGYLERTANLPTTLILNGISNEQQLCVARKIAKALDMENIVLRGEFFGMYGGFYGAERY